MRSRRVHRVAGRHLLASVGAAALLSLAACAADESSSGQVPLSPGASEIRDMAGSAGDQEATGAAGGAGGAGAGRDAGPAGGDVGETAETLGVTHVHALDVDPDDPEQVYVATHDGLLRFRDGAGLSRVGDIRSDVMGFAVGPAGELLASGHPAPDEDGPFALGLISSADRGQTWQPVALSGEADFHALDATGAGVFGYDAANGVLRVSDDGRTFDEVDTGVDYIDLAVDPRGARVLGTDEQARLVASDDGGRSFTPVAGAPRLVLVDVAPDGTVVGIGTDGTLHTAASSTDGAAWEQRSGSVDPGLQAFTAGPDGAVWVLDGRGLRRSEDLGDTFAQATGW